MEPDFKYSYRASLVRRYASRIPITSEGILTGFYRPDLLPFEDPQLLTSPAHCAPPATADLQSSDLRSSAEPDKDCSPAGTTKDAPIGFSAVTGEIQNKISRGDLEEVIDSNNIIANALRVAYVELGFDHGYPTIPSGMPFWSKLDFESGFAYACFQMFLEQGEEGPREIHQLLNNDELFRVFQDNFGKESTKQSLLFQLQEYFVIHYWYPRSRAFDLYRDTSERHSRLRRQSSMESRHYKLAKKALERLELCLDNDDFWAEVSPRVAFDALSKLVAIERVSTGLPAGGPLPVNQQPEATSFEMIMRAVAQQQGATQISAMGSTRDNGSHMKDMVDQILTDPTTVKSLQEVIVRISTVKSSGEENNNLRRFPGKQETIDVNAVEIAPDFAKNPANI